MGKETKETRTYVVRVRLARVIEVDATSQRDAEMEVCCWSDSKVLKEIGTGWSVDCLGEL